MNTGRSVTVCGRELRGSPHICAFFDSRESEYECVIPYYREGLERGERVVGIVDDDWKHEHLARLEAAGMPVDNAIRDDKLKVMTPGETYLRTGRFEMEEMFDAVVQMLDSSAAESTPLRTCAEMNWMSRSAVPPEEVMEYESRVNELTREHDCTLMCVYDLALLSGALVADIIATHPYVVLNQRVRENAHYIPPETYIKEVLRPRKTKKNGGGRGLAA